MVHKVNVVHTFVPHARRREAKTDAIIDVALGILVRDGLEALTLQGVARELGLVTTALYRYFPSKDALLAALQRRAVADVHARLTQARAAWDEAFGRRSPHVAALARLIALGRFYRALPSQAPETFHLVAVLLGDPRRLIGDAEAAITAPLLLALIADARTLIEHAEQLGALEHGDSTVRTVTLWASLHGLNLLDKLQGLAPGAPSRDALTNELLRALLRGFGADAATLTRAERAADSLPHGSNRERTV